MTENRPDFSNYLAHFTTNKPPVNKEEINPSSHVKNMSAYDRLASIIESKKIYDSILPWTNRRAVCLTECPWGSLLAHAKKYSSYAVGFNKPFIFGTGGGPAYYVRADHFEKQQWENHLYTFVTPFWPAYRPKKLKTNASNISKTVDYSHEREWRVPHELKFEYQHIEFVILDTYEDMAKFPSALKDDIGRNKFLLMDNYRQIEKIWPVHNI